MSKRCFKRCTKAVGRLKAAPPLTAFISHSYSRRPSALPCWLVNASRCAKRTGSFDRMTHFHCLTFPYAHFPYSVRKNRRRSLLAPLTARIRDGHTRLKTTGTPKVTHIQAFHRRARTTARCKAARSRTFAKPWSPPPLQLIATPWPKSPTDLFERHWLG